MFTMRKTATAARVALMAAAAGGMGSAMATNGYFPIGYGMKALGMGGASVASTDNGFAGANNPAAAAWSGTRIDAGASIFMPKRGYSRAGGAVDGSQDSDSNAFLVPEFGYNRTLSDKLGVGLTVYGNGGMNTNYAGGNTDCSAFPGGVARSNALCGPGRLGVNLMQLIVAPTLAYKVNENNSVGVSPLLVHQRFKAEGLDLFGGFGFSIAPGSLTGNGTDTSNGIGLRLGYLGKLNDMTSVGVSYSPKINMSKFGKYAGLFADGGDFDIPANFTVGVSSQVTPKVRLALDYSSIKYSGVPSVSNPSSAAGSPGSPGLGISGGGGFGWSDVNVVKIGVEWQQSSNLTLRAGVNVGDNPIKGTDVTFNIIAPGVTTSHLTLGGTYELSKQSEVTFAYMYVPKKSVSGSSFFNSLGPGAGGVETIQMSQQSIGLQYSWKY